MADDPDSPVPVATAENEIEAGIIVSVLESEGIQARMVGELTSGFRTEAPTPVTILVRRKELKQAEAILEERRENPG